VLTNCIIYFNTATMASNDTYGGSISHCCSPGLSGSGNTTNNPQFVNAPSSNYHLQASSPCIDTGTGLVSVADDIEGTPRPLDGSGNGTAITDIGAYEYVHATADTDGDGLTDSNEVAVGITSPVYDDSAGIAYVNARPADFDLYTSNTIMDLDMGLLMLQMSNGTVHLDLQLKRTDDLNGESWSNAGDAVYWERPASGDKAFFRVHGGE